MTREDRISTARIRGTVKVKVRGVSKRTQEARLRWCGHVMRSDGESDEKRALDMEVEGRRGRPKTRWKDCIAADMRKKDLDTGMTGGKSSSRIATKYNDGLIKLTKMMILEPS